MKKINFNCSTKNIPTPPNQQYSKKLIEMTEKLVKRRRWRAYHFLDPSNTATPKNYYGFNTRTSPQIPQLREFEYKMADLILSIEFRTTCNEMQFQGTLEGHVKTIKNSKTLYVRADKTTNYYQMQAKEYTSLLKKNVEKEYKKAPDDTEHSINLEAKHIANSLGITNRLDTLSQKSSFITLKDHKDNFANKPTCRLINPSKSELGRVSKSILEKINKAVVEKTGVQQWKNTRAALQWFNSIPNKNQNSFISFDIVNFYPQLHHCCSRKHFTLLQHILT